MELGGQKGQREELICPSCGEVSRAQVIRSVDVAQNPELKNAVRSGELFVWECPHCGSRNLTGGTFMYHDPAEKLLLVLSPSPLRTDGVMEGYTARQVRTVGDLIEKLNIFESGLDDVVMEMCKYITRHELGKDVALKFYRLGGADSTMIFTYPEDGKMQMVESGFKVYTECAGIINRNPAIRASVSGLADVSADWLSRFFA